MRKASPGRGAEGLGLAGPCLLELLSQAGTSGRAGGCEPGRGGGKKLWIWGEAVSMSKADLERLWEWSENIREEVGALSDAIVKLAAEDLPDEGDDKETIPASPPGVRCKNDIGGYISDRE